MCCGKYPCDDDDDDDDDNDHHNDDGKEIQKTRQPRNSRD